MKKHRPVTKAVIAAAGHGTRFLPATKNQPKEMLPIIDKPIIHYVVEEAVKSGITDIILVSRAGQHVMEDYFDNHLELEHALREAGKTDRLKMVQEIPQMANFVYVRQKGNLPYGNASPLIAAKKLIDDDEAFVYMFADDITLGNPPITRQLIEVYNEYHPSAVLATQEVPWNQVYRYATLEFKKDASYAYAMAKGYEKLNEAEAPSNMIQVGRFVFTHDVIKAVETCPTGKDGELWMIDVLNQVAHEGKKVYAAPYDGEWLTTGDPLNFMKAMFRVSMEREDLRDDILDYLKREILSYSEYYNSN